MTVHDQNISKIEYMETIIFECETITPMFLGGANGVTPELRAPSIKGALRFWWRAMNGHLPQETLREREGIIYGDTSKRSCFSIQTSVHNELLVLPSQPVPHKNYTQPAVYPGTSFRVIFRLTPFKSKDFSFDTDHLRSLFEIVVALGGLGKRVRRGMGSYRVTAIDGKPYKMISNAQDILQLIHKHSPHFRISNDIILASFPGAMLPFGWINRIEIGNPQNNITRKISGATHDVKGEYGNSYEPNLGHASNGRFASPIFVSVLGDGRTPIVTSLNTVPDRGKDFLDASIQDQFKSQILSD